MPALAWPRLPIAPVFAEGFCGFISLQVQRAELKLLHIGQRGIADVIDHHVKQDADPALMRLLHQITQILLVAHIGIELGPVLVVVTVIGIMWEIPFGTAADPAVDLL
ncbi:hypothetical protein D3C79_551200 [compost metagenome]